MRVVPFTDDPETAGFFAAAVHGRLVAQQCLACGWLQQPPRPRCRSCLGTELGWRDLPGTGRLYSWTVVEHQIHPDFPVPYTVVLIDADPPADVAPVAEAMPDSDAPPSDAGAAADRPAGPPLRFLGHVADRPALVAGAEFRVDFREVAPGVWIPNWIPAG